LLLNHYEIFFSKAKEQPVIYETVAEWEDIDHAGVMFYPRALTFVERGFGAWMIRQGTSWRELIVEQRLGFPAQGVQIDYVAPIRLHDPIQVHLGVAELTRKGFRLMFKIFRTEDRTLCCYGHIKRRFINQDAFKGIDLPDPVYALFETMASEREESAGQVEISPASSSG
jgi:YbgC/YbaW family acyl-CoA thioester hydrolase